MKMMRMCLCILFCWMCMGNLAVASEPDTWLLEELDLQGIERQLDQVLHEELDFSDTVTKVIGGETVFSVAGIIERVLPEVKAQWKLQKNTVSSILVLTLCAAFLTRFSGIFRNQQIAEVSFEFTYLLLFLVLLRGFREASAVTANVLTNLREFMSALIPAYFLSVTVASGAVTASVCYPFLLGVIEVVRWLIETILLPLTDAFVILVFVNHLTKEKHLSRLSLGIYHGTGWILKGLLSVVAGFHLIQGLISPAVDGLKHTAWTRAAAAVPGVGNLMGSVTDVLLGSGILIKNGIGAVGLFALVLICLAPLLRLGFYVLILELIGAFVQPVSDKRLVGCIGGMADAGKLLFRMVFTVAVLFILSIAMITLFTGVRI